MIKKLIVTLVAVVALVFSPLSAFSATPEATAAIQQVSRQLTLDSIWSVVLEQSQAVPVSKDNQAKLIRLANSAQAAINAKRYAEADAALADLLDLAIEVSRPKSNV